MRIGGQKIIMSICIEKYKCDAFEVLNNIKENNNNYDYEIQATKEDWHYFVDVAKTEKERLQLVMCLYMATPTLAELKNWDFDKFMEYAKETDSCFSKRFYTNLIKGE